MGNFYPPSGGNNRYPSSPNRYPPAGGNNRYPSSPNRYPTRAPLPSWSSQLWYASWDLDGSLNSTLSDGGAIGTVSNKGTLGSAADVTQATGTAQPTYRANGQSGVLESPALQFDGGDWLQSANFTSMGSAVKFAAVYSLSTFASTPYFLDGNDSSNRIIVYHAASDASVTVLSNGTGTDSGQDLSGLSEVQLAIYHVQTSSQTYAKLNEAAAGSLFNVGSSAYDGITIGARFGGTNMMTGYLWELFAIAIDGNEPSDADIESYFNARYGSGWPKT